MLAAAGRPSRAGPAGAIDGPAGAVDGPFLEGDAGRALTQADLDEMLSAGDYTREDLRRLAGIAEAALGDGGPAAAEGARRRGGARGRGTRERRGGADAAAHGDAALLDGLNRALQRQRMIYQLLVELLSSNVDDATLDEVLRYQEAFGGLADRAGAATQGGDADAGEAPDVDGSPNPAKRTRRRRRKKRALDARGPPSPRPGEQGPEGLGVGRRRRGKGRGLRGVACAPTSVFEGQDTDTLYILTR